MNSAAERLASPGAGDDLAAPDPRSDDELRRCIREGDPPERVLAAFELGRRLGAGVTGELRLDGEPSSGVRRHWLTVLASFGERDAVRAIAEQHVGDDEGEHAMHLALQLGLGDPAWWAERFVGASERMRAALLERAADRVDWSAVVPALEPLLRSDFAETRRLAADRLLSLTSHPGPSLRQYALERPSEAAAVLRAWARGPEHRELFGVLPVWSERRDAGLEALRDAGRSYALDEVRGRLVAYPALFALVRCPVDRHPLFELTGRSSGGRTWFLRGRTIGTSRRTRWCSRRSATRLRMEGDGDPSLRRRCGTVLTQETGVPRS